MAITASEKINKNIAIILCNYLTARLVYSRVIPHAVSTKNEARLTIVNRLRDFI